MKEDLTLNDIQRLICHKTQPTNPYEEISPQTILKNVHNSYKSNKKLVSKEDKFCCLLIDYYLIIPTIYGPPKTHKLDIPMRPILICGIGSAPP